MAPKAKKKPQVAEPEIPEEQLDDLTPNELPTVHIVVEAPQGKRVKAEVLSQDWIPGIF